MNKKKKILAISHTFIKKINLSFYEELGKADKFEISCIVPKKLFQFNKYIYPDFKKTNNQIKIIKSNLINTSTRFQYFEKIKNVIILEKPDIIIIDNDTVSLQSLIIIFFSFFYNFKIFYFCNENNIANIFEKFTLKKLFKLLVLILFNSLIRFKVSRVFCYSKQIKKNYDFLGYKNKTSILPLGFDQRIFNLNQRKKKQKKIVISYFGRISPEKGPHVLIDSLKKIKKFDWKFLLDIDQIENRDYYNKIFNILKKDFSSSRYNLIKCDHYQIAKFMKISDIVVIPSLHEEQYGRVIQEAVACGNVVIGSNIGAIPEIIKDKSLVFKPGDTRALTAIIKKLYNKSYYRKKFKKLYILILKERTISKQVYLFKKILQS